MGEAPDRRADHFLQREGQADERALTLLVPGQAVDLEGGVRQRDPARIGGYGEGGEGKQGEGESHKVVRLRIGY